MTEPLEAETIVLDGQSISRQVVISVARGRAEVSLNDDARRLIQTARQTVEATLDAGTVVYGLNTGFGSLSTKRIGPDAVRQLQRNLIRSHCAGVDQLLDAEVVRAMMVILAASLSRGHSGVRLELVERLVGLLNAEVTPCVPSRGSVGASGDLAPLAHIAAVLMGEGRATHGDRTMPGSEALQAAGLFPIELESKEGLALINGTHLMSALACLALADAERLLRAATGSAAFAVDAWRATDAFLDARLHAVRNQVGQQVIATRMRDLLEGTEIVYLHRDGDPRVQDPYSLRCVPQVYGAVYDTIEHVRTIVDRELGGVTDNPLVFPESGEAASRPIVSGGNFHGMPLAIALDALKIGLAHIAGMAERRIYHLLSATDPQNPITPYLSPDPGLHCGLMIAQYAAAACCNEIQTLAGASSVHNVPTSAGMEDYNSFGPASGHQARRIIELAERVIAVELISNCQALEYQRPARSGAGVEAMYRLVRTSVPEFTEDRPVGVEIERVTDLIRAGRFDNLL